jgi:hypothetical protein
VGGEGEEAASLHRWFDAQRLLPKKAARMGDEGKAVGSVLADGFAVSAAGPWG